LTPERGVGARALIEEIAARQLGEARVVVAVRRDVVTAAKIFADVLGVPLAALTDEEERRRHAQLVEEIEVARRHLVRTVVERQRDATSGGGTATKKSGDPIEHDVLDEGSNANHGRYLPYGSELVATVLNIMFRRHLRR
jgi:hypothetical protein